MKKSLVYTYGLLLFLTLITAVVSTTMSASIIALSLIMVFSAVKFLLVAFQLMELKKANSFWKMSLGFVLGLIVLLIIFIV